MSLSTAASSLFATNNNNHLHNHSDPHHQNNNQQQQLPSHQITQPHQHHSHNNMQSLHHQNQQEELNFSTFMDLCRFCSLKPGQKMNIFEKEAEHRQLLYKVRSVIPSVVGNHIQTEWASVYKYFVTFQISKDDLLPKKICNRCLAKLEDLIEWRDRAMNTDKVLRNYSESMRVVTSTINFQVNIIIFRARKQIPIGTQSPAQNKIPLECDIGRVCILLLLFW